MLKGCKTLSIKTHRILFTGFFHEIDTSFFFPYSISRIADSQSCYSCTVREERQWLAECFDFCLFNQRIEHLSLDWARMEPGTESESECVPRVEYEFRKSHEKCSCLWTKWAITLEQDFLGGRVLVAITTSNYHQAPEISSLPGRKFRSFRGVCLCGCDFAVYGAM